MANQQENRRNTVTARRQAPRPGPYHDDARHHPQHTGPVLLRPHGRRGESPPVARRPQGTARPPRGAAGEEVARRVTIASCNLPSILFSSPAALPASGKPPSATSPLLAPMLSLPTSMRSEAKHSPRSSASLPSFN